MIDRLQQYGTINANLIVYISVPIKDFIHNYPRALFNDIPGSGRRLITTYLDRAPLKKNGNTSTLIN